MAANMEIEDHWEAGFVQEVLDGTIYKPSGVCPHQCWSETGILHPGIRGMIGWAPRALENAAALSPMFPIMWDRAAVRNLRVGGSALRMSFIRMPREIVYRLFLTQGRPVTVDFAPGIPAGMSIVHAFVNGKEIKCPSSRRRGLLAEAVRVLVRDSTEIRFECSGGVGVVPLVAHPVPGDSSAGFRFIGGSLAGLEYGIDVEGKSGTAGTIRVVALDQDLLSVSGGTLLPEQPGGGRDIHIPFGFSPSGRVLNHIVITLSEPRR
jgi:hypothetical protein